MVTNHIPYMKRTLLAFIGILLCLHSFAQQKFYINPSVGIVWNRYVDSNERITGNMDVGNIFWDNDCIPGFLVGYKFDNNIILESGLIYHNADNRFYFSYSEISDAGGGSGSLNEGYYCIPLNIKYRITPNIPRLKIVPYVGLSFSTHTINASPYTTMYHINYAEGSTLNNMIPLDTTAIIRGYRPSKNNILINTGVSLEYQIFDRLIFTLSSNFTFGFRDFNRLDIDVILPDRIEYGEIAYRGNKFYISAGVMIPFGFKK